MHSRNERARVPPRTHNSWHSTDRVEAMGATDNLCLGMALVYSFFGVTLAVSPKLCWGPDSPFS